jgi:predicted permease
MAFHPRMLRGSQGSIPVFIFLQMVVAFLLVVAGSCIARNVEGFQTSFAKFGGYNRIPYYGMIYYRSVAQAAYGAALIFVTITTCAIVLVYDHYESKRALTQAVVERRDAEIETW